MLSRLISSFRVFFALIILTSCGGVSITDFSYNPGAGDKSGPPKSEINVIHQSEAPGTLDLTFAGTGSTPLEVGPSETFSQKITVQKDGKPVVLVTASDLNDTYHVGVVRYNTDGTLDTSYGTSGKAVLDSIKTTYPSDIAIQDDGKAVVVGYYYNESDDTSGYFVLRLTSDGQMDPAFNGGQIEYIQRPNGYSGQVSVVVSKSMGLNKITMVGSSFKTVEPIQLNDDGTFTVCGTIVGYFEPIPAAQSSTDYFLAGGIAQKPDGRFVVAISRVTQNAQGKPNVYGKWLGYVTYSSMGQYESMQLQDVSYLASYYPTGILALADGSVVVAGSGDEMTTSFSGQVFHDPRGLLMKFQPNENLDIPYGGYYYNGFRVGFSRGITGLALDNNGKVIVFGTKNRTSRIEANVIRLKADGLVDLPFGELLPDNTVSDGAWLNFSKEDTYCTGIAVDPSSNKFVLACLGRPSYGTNDRLVTFRLWR